MPRVTRAETRPIGEKPGKAAAKLHTTSRDWTARGAALFWIGVSGVVWIALAAWLY